MASVPSDKAIDCFVHGLSHFIWELGPDLGLSRALDLLHTLQHEDLLEALIGEAPEAFENGEALSVSI